MAALLGILARCAAVGAGQDTRREMWSSTGEQLSTRRKSAQPFGLGRRQEPRCIAGSLNRT
jgi:hypothetical protein